MGAADGDQPRAVIFDFYGTLIPSIPPETWRAHARDVAEALAVSTGMVEEALDRTYGDRLCGRAGGPVETMRLLARLTGSTVDDDAIRVAVERRQRRHRSLFTPREGAEAVLDALRAQGFRLGLLSDCTDELPAAWAGLPLSSRFDAVAFSFVEGRRKPDAALYEVLASRLGVAPDRCVYLGDGAGDELRGAEAAGMRAVLLDTGVLDGDSLLSAPGHEWCGDRCTELEQIVGIARSLVSSTAEGAQR